jgi:hypothetical protein
MISATIVLQFKELKDYLVFKPGFIGVLVFFNRHFSTIKSNQLPKLLSDLFTGDIFVMLQGLYIQVLRIRFRTC